MHMIKLGISEDNDMNILDDAEDMMPATSIIQAEAFGKGDMPLSAIKAEDLAHPRTVADRAAQGDLAFEAELARDRAGLHAEAQGLFLTDRAAHNRLIHKAWLNARRVD